MATPYSAVYDQFLQKISDYAFLQMTPEDIESNLFGYLRSAITKFRRCKNDLSQRDDTQFIVNLSDEEIEILSIYMVVEYLSPKIITSDLIKPLLSDSDYRTYSQANHIKEIRTLRDMYQSEAETAMVRYTLYNTDFEDFNRD